MEWHAAGWSVCLPLLIFPCTIKSRCSLLAPAHPGRRAGWSWWWCGGSVARSTYITEEQSGRNLDKMTDLGSSVVQHVLPRCIQHDFPAIIAVEQTFLSQRDCLPRRTVQAVRMLELGGRFLCLDLRLSEHTNTRLVTAGNNCTHHS